MIQSGKAIPVKSIKEKMTKQVKKSTIQEQTVAIKVIDMKRLKSQFNKNLLQSEIELLKLLKPYPNILSLQEVYTTRNNTYIVSQLCKEDLHQTIRRKGKLTQNEAVHKICEILEAYKHFHELGIVHRDLKPANILVNKNGTLKIADLGFAIKIQKLDKLCTHNVGSPLYMSPQALGRSQYSFKSDIWAIGVIFYQMLTGTTPWQAKYEKDLLKKIENQDILLKLQKLNLSPIINDFLQSCLTRNTDQRICPDQLIEFKGRFALRRRNSIDSKQFKDTLKCIQLKKNSTQHETTNTKANNIMSLFEELSVKKSIGMGEYPFGDIRHPFDVLKSKNILRAKNDNEDDEKQKDENSSQDTDQISNSREKQIQKSQNNKHKMVQLSMNIKKTVSLTEPREEDSSMSELNIFQQEKKLANKLLLSQIHLCRYIFKLAVRIKDSLEAGVIIYCIQDVSSILTSYARVIRDRLQGIQFIVQNNLLNLLHHQQYIESKSCQSILRISNDYLAKYSIELFPFWKDPRQNQVQNIFETKTTVQLIKSIHSSLKEKIPNKGLFKDMYSNDIIILDYLMTCRQLLRLSEGNQYHRFANKSRIQDIIEGSSTQITYNLYCKIAIKAQQILQKL